MPHEGRALIKGLLASQIAAESRIDADVRDRMPADTLLAAEIPASVRLEFTTDADAVRIDLESAPAPHPLASPDADRALTVWDDNTFVESVPIAIAGASSVTIRTPRRGAPLTVFLPDAFLPRVTAVQAINGTLEPFGPRRRWLAYGDSITQGWSAASPGHAYPAIVARELGLDLYNLGFAASARGEQALAEQISTTPAQLITLAFGTNNWSRTPTGRQHIAGILEDFIATIKRSHDETPIVIISPLLRPDAEATPNAVGATLEELRATIESTAQRIGARDPSIHLLEGRGIVTDNQLVDGVHPGNEGHQAIAQALSALVNSLS